MSPGFRRQRGAPALAARSGTASIGRQLDGKALDLAMAAEPSFPSSSSQLPFRC